MKRAKDALHAIQQLDVFEVNVVVRDEAHVQIRSLAAEATGGRTENEEIAIRKQTTHVLWGEGWG